MHRLVHIRIGRSLLLNHRGLDLLLAPEKLIQDAEYLILDLKGRLGVAGQLVPSIVVVHCYLSLWSMKPERHLILMSGVSCTFRII